MKAFWRFLVASGAIYLLIFFSIIFIPPSILILVRGSFAALLPLLLWAGIWLAVIADFRIDQKRLAVKKTRVALPQEDEVKVGLQADLEDWDERYKNSLSLAELRSRSTRNG